MTTTRNPRRFGAVLLQLVAIAVMLFCGLITTFLGMMTSPQNYIGQSFEHFKDIAVIRMLTSLLLLFLIPFYRKIPLVLIIAGGFGAVIVQADPYVLAVGLTVWIVRAQHRWQWAIAGGGILAILVNIAWHALAVRHWDNLDPWEGTAYVLIFGMAMLVTVLSIGFMTRQRRSIQQAQDAVEQVEHDRDEISSQMTRQTEREFLAREVHDTLAQRLTALSLQAGRMRRSMNTEDNTELTVALDETKQYSDQALKDLRNLVSSLRAHGEQEPAVPAVAPLGYADLKALLQDAAAQGLTIEAHIMLNGYDDAPDDLQRAVIRIAQEGLTNVLRHSPDQTVQLRLEGQPVQGLVMTMTNRRDHTSAFDGGTGTGLLGIKERAQLVGGTAVEEYLPQHFRLTVRLPWTVTVDPT